MDVFEYGIFFKFNFCNTSFVTEISMFYITLLRIPSFVLFSKSKTVLIKLCSCYSIVK